jgi:hypothetical protein
MLSIDIGNFLDDDSDDSDNENGDIFDNSEFFQKDEHEPPVQQQSKLGI